MTSRWPGLLLASPLALILALFLIVPIGTIVVVSFFDYDSVRMFPAFVWTNYEELLFSPITWKTYLQTLQFAAITGRSACWSVSPWRISSPSTSPRR